MEILHLFKYICNFKIFNLEHRLVHTDEKPHGCKICPKRYKSRTDLTHHTNDVHRRSKNRDFKCLHCNKTFFNKRALTAHSYTHVQRVMFSCYFCKKGFAHRAYLEIHLRTHTHEKPFSCPILSCQYSCSQASSLTGHKKRNHEQTTGMTTAKIKTSCYFCGKIFTSPDHFLTHIRTHTREIPFTCGLCQKGFKSQDVLKHHISTTHTKEKPYNCVECQKCFLTKAQLTEHVGAVHRKERRYFCEICSYGTYHKNHLKGHSLRQHKAKLWLRNCQDTVFSVQKANGDKLCCLLNILQLSI